MERARPPAVWVVIGLGLLAAIVVLLVVLVIRVAPGTAPAITTPSPTADTRLEELFAEPVRVSRCSPVLDDEVKSSEDLRSFVAVSHGFGLVTCLLDALDAPDSVYLRIEQTRPVDGTQAAEWGRVVASWTFDGEDELRVVFELVN